MVSVSQSVRLTEPNLRNTFSQQEPTLRDYQTVAVSELRAAISKLRASSRDPRVLLVAPTGSGKGTLASWMILRAVQNGKRVVFLVNRRELVKDLSRRLFKLGINHGVIMGTHPARPWLPVQVASIDTLHRREHLPQADLIFLDEAHFSISPIWLKVIERYCGVPMIGMTATPCRQDGRGLGDIYNEMVECPGTAALTEIGHLAPARVFAPSSPDLTGVRTQAGDYNQKQLADAVDRGALVGDIVGHWQRLASDRPTVAFAVNVKHSQHIVEQFRAAGVTAEHVDANTPDDRRDELWESLASGRIQVCSSVGVISYGWDVPCVSCAILARPTQSLALYLQQIGRVLRTAPGKVDALILDHSGNVLQHGLPDEPREWSLDGAGKKKKTKDEAPPVRMCQQCWRAFRPAPACPHCGFVFPVKEHEVKHTDGELTEITSAPGYQIKKLSENPLYAWFQEEALRRQKKHTWAWAMCDLWERGKVRSIDVPADVLSAWEQFRGARRRRTA